MHALTGLSDFYIHQTPKIEGTCRTCYYNNYYWHYYYNHYHHHQLIIIVTISLFVISPTTIPATL